VARNQCKATIHNGGAEHRCNKDRGHHKAKDQATAIHDASGVTWYDGDLDQYDSED
jgi:hypothetical protein